MTGHMKSNHNQYVIPTLKKESPIQNFITYIILSFVLFSTTVLAGLDDVKSIIITSSKLNASGWLQVSEVIATQTGTGKDLSHISEGAIASNSSSFSKESNATNVISGVAPARYPKIFHSGRNDKNPTIKITLAVGSELDSITLYGRADCCENRDIYDLVLVDSTGKIIFQKSDLSASNSSHFVRIDLTGNIEKITNNTVKSNSPAVRVVDQPKASKDADQVLLTKQKPVQEKKRGELQQKQLIILKQAEAARSKNDNTEAIRLFQEFLDSKPPLRLAMVVKNGLKTLVAKEEEIALEKFRAENGGMRPKEKIAFDKLMNPLINDINSEFYKSLHFTVTKKKETSQTHGFFTRRVLWLNVNIRFNDVDTLIRKYEALEPAIKKHIKKELESIVFTKTLRVHANYSVLVDDRLLANTTATYDKIKWDIKSNTKKEEISGKLAELKSNQLPPILGGVERSEKEIFALLKPIRKKSNILLKGWLQYQNQKLSSLPRRNYQSDMVDFSRDEAPELLSPIVDAALRKLTKIDKDNIADYNNLDKKVLQPIRKLLDDSLLIWNYGFNVGVPGYVGSGGPVPLAQLVQKLVKYQYPWVQRNRVKILVFKPAFKVARSTSELSVSSFTSEGLNYEAELMAIYLGDFENSRIEKNSQGLSSIFSRYLNAYGKYCDSYLPPNKVAITLSKCETERVTKNGFGMVTNTSCVRWVDVPTGLYADPKLYSSSKGLSADAGINILKKAFSGDPFASRAVMDNSLSLGNDMSNLVQKNKCDNVGLKRFENNLYRFVEGKTSLLLPGKEKLASTRNIKYTSFDADNLNLTELIDHLIIENSKGWTIIRYVSGSAFNIRKGRNNVGSGSVTASYAFYGIQQKELGNVTLTFKNDLPKCLYFFDAPQTCRKPSRKIINKYEKGLYLN